MPEDAEDLINKIREKIKELNKTQSESLLKRLSAAFVIGYRKSGSKIEISDVQRQAVKKLTKEQFGYITEFNEALGKQLEGRVKELIAEGKGYADIRGEMKPFIQEVFSPNGAVTIDRTGQTRQVVQVMRDGSLRRVDKVITRPYITSPEAYADMLSRTVTHQAYERGRTEGYKTVGIRKWRFVGPADERSRSWHVALLGKVFEYDTPESDMALDVLSEPNCRHRAVPFFDDPELDTGQEFFERQKERAGLRFKDGEWKFAG